jgi:hypothetical protein
MSSSVGMAQARTPTANPQSAGPSADGEGPRERSGAYAVVLLAYTILVGGFVALLRRSGRALPREYSPQDIALVGIATHKASRLLAKDLVTTPLREPFTDHEDRAGPGEVSESPREGSGVRHAIGELVSCPFCVAQWVATTMAAGLAVIPRTTRFVAATLSAVTISDFLQIAYKASEERL